MQDRHKNSIDGATEPTVCLPAMPTNEGKKAILISAKHHNMLRYICNAAHPQTKFIAQAEAMIEDAYRRLRKLEINAKSRATKRSRQRV